MREVYFDHAATTALDAAVLAEMLPFLGEACGNPSALHRRGRQTRQAVERARHQMAAAIGAHEGEIVFTGGGSEADTLAIVGFAQTLPPGHVITSAIEHPAVAQAVRFLERSGGWQVSVVPVDGTGRVDADAFAAAFRADTRLASVMLANNVVGTIQPVAELARVAHEKGALFHADAVQAVGAIPVDVTELDVDLLSVSAHKFYGPKGIGALYVRRGVTITPIIHGGGQERGLRSGTENVPGIVGMGAAATAAVSRLPAERPRLEELRDKVIDGVLASVEGATLLGHRRRRLPGNACFTVRFVEGESMVLRLDAEGVAASSGSACASAAAEPSRIVTAMGYDAVDARGSLRLTLGKENDAADVEYFLDRFPAVVNALRAMSPLSARS